MRFMFVHQCVFVYMCVRLCPSESNGPRRQASVHQQTAGISALPEYRWTTGAWQRAPPPWSQHRMSISAAVCVRVLDTVSVSDTYVYIHTEIERCLCVCVCLRDRDVCEWPLTSGYVSQLCVCVCVSVCVCVRVWMRGRPAVIDLTRNRPALNTWTVATNTLTPSITAPLEAQRVCTCVCVSVCAWPTAKLMLLLFNGSTIDYTYNSVMIYLY